MKKIFSIIIPLTFSFLCISSCNKEPEPSYQELSYQELFYQNYLAGNDEKKIDVKGSLSNGDMRHPNFEAYLVGNTLYVCFYETIENCMTLLTNENGDVLFSRRMEKQYPAPIRIYMGNEPTGTYRVYITDGINEAEGTFLFENQQLNP